MTLSVLNLNINADNYWDNLTEFLKNQHFDILCFQEVTGKDTKSGNIHSTRDVFLALQELLKDTYDGQQVITQRYASGIDSYLGNAVFYNKELNFIYSNNIPMYVNTIPFPTNSSHFETVGRALMHLTFLIDGKTVSVVNTHFAWAKTPVQQPHQTKQAEILLTYIQSIPNPYIICGDFNLAPNQPLIQSLSKIAKNVTAENGVKNTLNPRTHRARKFFPNGVAVDYIFVSRDVTVSSFSVLGDLDLSDHLGLTATLIL